MKNKILIISVAVLIICISIIGCTMTDTADPTAESTSEPKKEGYSDAYIDGRSSWNIEMEFYELTEKAIVIRIVDYDNIGYAYNDLYYELEYFENGIWVPLTHMNKKAGTMNVRYHIPSQTKDYCDLLSFNMRQLLPEGVTLKTGHYRITKILSGKEFSLEFDMTVEE